MEILLIVDDIEGRRGKQGDYVSRAIAESELGRRVVETAPDSARR